MAAELITPVDERTGLPYLIAPEQYALPLNNPGIANRHHLWHPSNDPLFETVAGTALRVSMLQTVEADLHNFSPRAYHKVYKGPELPQTTQEIFKRCVLACAGVLPDGVIDLRSGEPVERPMAEKEREYFRIPSSSDEFGYRYIRYGYGQIRDFLADYVASQSLNHITPTRIEEFLETKDMDRKRKVGRLLLSGAIAVASDTLREPYFTLRRDDQLHPRMPPEPQTLIRYKLGNTSERLEKVMPRLEENLLAAV